MPIVRIIILILVVIYFLLALVFIHNSMSYMKQLGRSSEALHSLFASQIALFKMLAAETDFEFCVDDLAPELEKRNFKVVNKVLSEKKLDADAFIKTLPNTSSKAVQVKNGLEENVTLIRNEVYRYNKIIENLNINKESLIFVLFVAMLRLKTFEKI